MAGVILGACCFETPSAATQNVELPSALASVSSAHFHFLAVDCGGRLYRLERVDIFPVRFVYSALQLGSLSCR